MEKCEDSEEPTYTHICKHCPAVGFECEWCDGTGESGDEEDPEDPGYQSFCDLCKGEGVLYVRDVAMCDTCDTRLDAPYDPDAKQFCAECRAPTP